MSKPESTASIAARLAAEVGVKTIIAASKFCDLLLGGRPKLRPPAFDEAEAQRFLSDGAEELAVAEERERAVDPGRPTSRKYPWSDTNLMTPDIIVAAGVTDMFLQLNDLHRTDICVQCAHCRRVLPSPGKFSTHLLTCDLKIADPLDAPEPADDAQPIPGTITLPNWEPTDRSGLRYPISEHPLYAEIQDRADAAIVSEVLAQHYYRPAGHSSIGIEGHCGCGGRPIDLRDWQQHVAPLIVAALQQ